MLASSWGFDRRIGQLRCEVMPLCRSIELPEISGSPILMSALRLQPCRAYSYSGTLPRPLGPAFKSEMNAWPGAFRGIEILRNGIHRARAPKVPASPHRYPN